MALGVNQTSRYEYFTTTDLSHPEKIINNNMGSRRQAEYKINSNNSPLLQMQKQYQRKLLAEKEKKIAELGYKAQENSMRHVAENSSKQVRGYFQRSSSDRSRQTNSNYRESTWSGNSDRRKLPPIEHSNTFHDEHKVEYRRKTKLQKKNSNIPLHQTNIHQESMKNRHPSKNNLVKNNKPPIHFQESKENEKENGNESPPPNLAKLRALSHKKIQEKRNKLKMLNNRKLSQNVEDEDADLLQHSTKLTDFQKWQIEQNMERQKRLEKHRHANEAKPNLLSNVSISDVDPYGDTPPRPSFQESNSFESKTTTTQNKAKSKPFDKLRRKIASSNFNENISYEDTPKQDEIPLEAKPFAFFDKTYSKQHGLSEQMHAFQINNKVKEKMSNKAQNLKADSNSVLAGFNKPVLVRRDGRSTAGSRSSNKNTPSAGHHNKVHTNLNKPGNNHTHRQSKNTERYNENWRGQAQTKETVTTHAAEGQVLSHDTLSIPEYENIVLVPCNSCGRNFKKDRLQSHLKVCKKTAHKKRKAFNMAEARKKGTENEHFTTVPDNIMSKKYAAATKNTWRQQHEDFIKTIKYAKKTSDFVAGGGNLKDLPPPPPSLNPNYVQCKYCERRFAPQAAERHIPRCKEIKSRQLPAPKIRKTKKK